MLLLPTCLLDEIFFLESSEQKPLMRAHTLNSYTQLADCSSFLRILCVGITLLEVLKWFQICWDQIHSLMVFLISNYSFFNTWGLC